MVRNHIEEGHKYNPVSKRIELDAKPHEERARYTIGSVTVRNSPESFGQEIYDWPTFFKALGDEQSVPQIYSRYEKAVEIFKAFPEDAKQCFEDYEALHNPDLSMDELAEITERAAESLKERQGYVEILADVLNHTYQEAKDSSKNGYYDASNENDKVTRDRWHKVRADVKGTVLQSAEEYETEVLGTIKFITDSAKVLGDLKYNIQDANMLFDVVSQDFDLRTDLARNKEKLAVLVDEVPTSQGIKYKINGQKLARFISANPELLKKDPEEAKDVVARTVEVMQSNILTLEDRVERLAPKVDSARFGINTRCRQVKAELWKMLDVLETGNLDDTGIGKNIKKRAEIAIARLEMASNDGQAAYEKEDLEPAEQVVSEAESLTLILARDLKSSTQDAGQQVLMAMGEAGNESLAILSDQKSGTEQAVKQYRTSVLLQTEEYEGMSSRLVNLRDVLSSNQSQAKLNLTDVEVARKLMKLQQRQLAMVGAAKNLMEENSDRARQGYTGYYNHAIEGKYLHTLPETVPDEQIEEFGPDQIDVQFAILGKSISQLASLDEVSSAVSEIDAAAGQFISEGAKELRALQHEYQQALQKSHQFLLEHLTDGLSDLLDLGHKVLDHNNKYSIGSQTE